MALPVRVDTSKGLGFNESLTTHSNDSAITVSSGKVTSG
jgi:hypothetical protein